MTVLILENNLMWSARLAKSVRALGFTAVVLSATPETLPPAEAAIVNLANPDFDLQKLVPILKSQGTHVIGHAGHKEKALWDEAKGLDLNQMVSHSLLTHKLDAVLAACAQSAQP